MFVNGGGTCETFPHPNEVGTQDLKLLRTRKNNLRHFSTLSLLLVVSTIATCSPATPEVDLSSRAQSATKYRPLIGLVELPGVFGRSDPSGPPGQIAPSQGVSLPIFDAPGSNSPVLTIREPEVIDAEEHGYEERSAKVYAEERGWYEIGLRGISRTTGWVSPKDAGPFRNLETLFSEHLMFVTNAWDRRLLSTPISGSAQLAPAIRGLPEAITQAESARFGEGPEPNGARVVESRRVGESLWFRIELHEANCLGRESRAAAAGWVPAYSATGALNLWFHSRGC